ncbi:MAG: hypothetical protein OXB91_01220 [Bryobacterales bacterium]|nr:hypothetical protein [Bryobacterales bacterium]
MNNVVVDAFEVSSITAGGLAQRVQALDRGWRNDEIGVLGMDFAQRPSIALNFLLGPILGFRVAQHDRFESVWGDNDPFDPIGRLSALNERRITQRRQ